VRGSSRLARVPKGHATTVEPMIPEKALLELPLGLLLSRDAVAPVHGNTMHRP
jgi:hypothetical protein